MSAQSTGLTYTDLVVRLAELAAERRRPTAPLEHCAPNLRRQPACLACRFPDPQPRFSVSQGAARCARA